MARMNCCAGQLPGVAHEQGAEPSVEKHTSSVVVECITADRTASA